MSFCCNQRATYAVDRDAHVRIEGNERVRTSGTVLGIGSFPGCTRARVPSDMNSPTRKSTVFCFAGWYRGARPFEFVEASVRATCVRRSAPIGLAWSAAEAVVQSTIPATCSGDGDQPTALGHVS